MDGTPGRIFGQDGFGPGYIEHGMSVLLPTELGDVELSVLPQAELADLEGMGVKQPWYGFDPVVGLTAQHGGIRLDLSGLACSVDSATLHALVNDVDLMGLGVSGEGDKLAFEQWAPSELTAIPLTLSAADPGAKLAVLYVWGPGTFTAWQLQLP